MGSAAAIQLDHKSGTSQAFRLDTLCRSVPPYTTNAVWSAFEDGMKILYRYAGRSGADSTLIAKANLRLLHDTLLADTSYRERLTVAENEVPENGLSTIYNLFTSQGLRADLITLQAGCDTALSSSDLYNHMYMLIYGEVTINNTMNLQEGNNQSAQQLSIHRKSWWKQLRHSSNKNICKQRDVILFGQKDQAEKTLSALKHRCVLLRVSTPYSMTM